MKTILIVATGAVAVSAASIIEFERPTREPDLVGTRTSVFSPDDARLGWFGGLIAPEDYRVPGFTAVYDDAAKPKFSLLGCRFDIALVNGDPVFRSASEALLETTPGDNPTSVMGKLVNPRRNPIADPTTTISCENSSSYYFFLYRHPVGLFGNSGLTAVILEYSREIGDPIENPMEWSHTNATRSARALGLISKSEQMYQVRLMTPESAGRASEESERLFDWLVDKGPKLVNLALALG